MCKQRVPVANLVESSAKSCKSIVLSASQSANESEIGMHSERLRYE